VRSRFLFAVVCGDPKDLLARLRFSFRRENQIAYIETDNPPLDYTEVYPSTVAVKSFVNQPHYPHAAGK